MSSYTWKMRLRVFLAVMMVASLLAAVFWGCWRLSAGGVPQVSNIRMWWGTYYVSAFGLTVSRWWDVLFFGLWAGLMSLTVGADESRQLYHEELREDLAPAFVIPGLVTLILWIIYLFIGPLIPLGLGLVVSVIIGLVIADDTDVNRVTLSRALRRGWKQGLLIGLFFGGWFALPYSFSNGMVLGLLMNLFAASVWMVGIGCGLTVGLTIKALNAPEPDPPDPARQDDLCPGGQRPDWMPDK